MKKATTTLLFAFAAVALVLASWWWLRSDDGAPLPVDASSVPQANASVASPAAAAPASASASEPERTAAVDAAAAGSELTADEGRFYSVLVVDEVSQPIAGADVWGVDEAVFKRSRTLPQQDYRSLQREPDALAERFGRTARSDANGRLRLFADKKGLGLHGRHGGRYGRLRIASTMDDPPDGHRLVLVPDETLRVRVRDAAGQPATDVPIDLRRRLADGSERDVVIGDDRDTDRDGMVAFPHVQLVRKAQDDWHGSEPVAAVFVQVAIHGLPPIRAVFDASLPVPAEPVELQLPPCGSLSVRFLLGGQPLPAVESIHLHAGPEDDVSASNHAWTQPVEAEGWAHFPFVPVQPTLFVQAATAGRLPDFAVAGPAAPGLAVRHEVELANQAVVLRGRVLQPDGAPLDTKNVAPHLSYGMTRLSGSGSLRCDSEARFLLVFHPREADGEAGSTKVRLDKFEVQAEVDGVRVQAKVEPRELQIGVNDLGDVRLQAEPLVCAGRLVGYAPGRGRTNLVVEVGRSTKDDVRWQPEYAYRSRLADDGTFVVYGSQPNERLRLTVVSSHLLPVAPVEFVRGQRDLTLVVEDGAVLELDCLLPAGGSLEELALMLRGGPADASAPPENVDGRARRPDPRRARFERRSDTKVRALWGGLPAGSYTLCVELPGHGAALHERSGIVLPLPAAASQAPIDLREWMRWVQVDLRLADGGTVPRQRWTLLPQPQPMTDDAVWGGTSQFATRGQLLLGRSVRELLVAGDGFVPQRVAIDGDAVLVAMRPWQQLELALAPGTALPEGTAVLVSLASSVERPRNARYRASGSAGDLERLLAPDRQRSQAPFVDGRATLPIGDGVHRLVTSLQLGNRSFPLVRAVPGEVVAGGHVVVTLDADEVRAVAERLRSAVGDTPAAGEPK